MNSPSDWVTLVASIGIVCLPSFRCFSLLVAHTVPPLLEE
jgi:hypothetical protein